MCKVSGMTTGSHERLAVCLGEGEDASENCTAWRQFLLVQVFAVSSVKANIKQLQGCFRMQFRNRHIKCQLTLAKRYTTVNLPKTWSETIRGSRLSSSQRRTSFQKNRPERALPVTGHLHWQVPGLVPKKAAAQCVMVGSCDLCKHCTLQCTRRACSRLCTSTCNTLNAH